VAGCDDDPTTEPVIIEGSWLGTISETADTCDAFVEPVTDVSILITDEGDSHHVRIDNLVTQQCWVQPFTLGENAMTWSNGATTTVDCNDGCRMRVDSSVTLEFESGGIFTGTETLTFTPLNAACDHPDCGFPCSSQDRHVIFPPIGEICTFSCETTYTWTAAATEEFLEACL
jgi:hypothetical protein